MLFIQKRQMFLLIWLKELILQIELMLIFVSIHCNANRNTTADGTETYVMGMNKIASNLEAAKKRTLLLL
jgi:hypothetical protein